MRSSSPEGGGPAASRKNLKSYHPTSSIIIPVSRDPGFRQGRSAGAARRPAVPIRPVLRPEAGNRRRGAADKIFEKLSSDIIHYHCCPGDRPGQAFVRLMLESGCPIGQRRDRTFRGPNSAGLGVPKPATRRTGAGDKILEMLSSASSPADRPGRTLAGRFGRLPTRRSFVPIPEARLRGTPEPLCSEGGENPWDRYQMRRPCPPAAQPNRTACARRAMGA